MRLPVSILELLVLFFLRSVRSFGKGLLIIACLISASRVGDRWTEWLYLAVLFVVFLVVELAD
jgi:hypothetical protein